MSTGGMFTASEIVQMAVQTEQNGYAFYNAAAQAAQSGRVRELLQGLAQAEQEHEQTFRAMLDVTAESGPPEEYPGQKSAYIQALLDSRVLPDAEAGKAVLAEMTQDVEALDFAIGFEKDTILFMYEMRDMVPERQASTVDRLIAEERSHVRQLTELKSQIA
jgi:rubrerythrin